MNEGQAKFAARRVSKQKEFIAYSLEQFRDSEGMKEAELMEWLGCDEMGYYRLALCKLPSIDSSSFSTALSEISLFSGADPEKLVRAIKRATIIERLAGSNFESSEGILLAARDGPPDGDTTDETDP